jgi:hypothetical protein
VGAVAAEVSVTSAPVAASVGVEVNVGVMIGKGVAVTVTALDEGDGFGVTVSVRGMINGGSVVMTPDVGVRVTPRGVGVRDGS